MSRHLDYNAAVVPGGSFTWGEYARLKDWNVLLIPNEAQRVNAVFLFEKLQAFRRELGRALIITSGARNSHYTQWLRKRGIPAALQSAHLDWQAVDLQCPELSNKTLWHFFDKHWPGRMEYLSATPSWVHLDTRNWGNYERFSP